LAWAHSRACSQLLDRGIDHGLVDTTERLEDLTFPEECGKDGLANMMSDA